MVNAYYTAMCGLSLTWSPTVMLTVQQNAVGQRAVKLGSAVVVAAFVRVVVVVVVVGTVVVVVAARVVVVVGVVVDGVLAVVVTHGSDTMSVPG